MATITEVFARSGFSTTPNTLIYSVDPAAEAAVVTNIVVVNTTNAPQTFTILFDDVEVFDETEIAPKATITVDLKQALLSPSGEITGSASNANVKVHMSGVVIQ